MTRELFTIDGDRKYLTAEEQEAFLEATRQLERAEVRTLCMTLAYTGCRITEALQLAPSRVDLSTKGITFQTLKQRGKVRYRTVPVPDSYLEAIELVHRIRTAQKTKDRGATARLWPWGRTQATKHVKDVMALAGITGAHATPKGLRHGFGVRMAQKTRNPRLIQKWLGHAKLETTTIYMDMVGDEERKEAVNAWR